MRLMAIAAGQLPEAHRMNGRLEEVHTCFLVAVVANLGLTGLCEHRVVLGVNLVTTGTGKIAALVRAGVPADAGITPMTIQADLVLQIG